MAEFIADDELVAPAKPSAAVGANGFPRVSPELQAQRNQEAAKLLQREQADPNLLPAERELISPYVAKMTAANPFQTMGGDPARVALPGARVSEPQGGSGAGGGGFISDAELTGNKPATATDPSNLRRQVSAAMGWSTGVKPVDMFLGLPAKERAKDIIGSGMQLQDMFTGILGGIYSHFGFLTGNTMGLAKGEDRETAAKIGKEFAGILPPAVVAPYGELAQLDPRVAKMYQENPVATAMEWFSKTITQGSERMAKESKRRYDAGLSLNYLPAEWFEQAASSVMAGFGYRGTASALRRGFDARAQAELKKAAEQKADEARMAATLAVENFKTPATMTPEEFARQPVQQSINNLLGIRPAAEQARLLAERRKQARQGFRDPEQGGDYVDLAESQFRAGERTPPTTPGSERLADTIRDKYLRMAEDAELRAGRVAQADSLRDMTPRPSDLRGESPRVPPTALAETLADKYLKAAEAAELKAAQAAQAERLQEITANRGDLRGKGANVPPELRAEVLGQDVLSKLTKDELQAGFDALSDNLKAMTVTPTELSAIMRGRRVPAVEQRLMNQNGTPGEAPRAGLGESVELGKSAAPERVGQAEVLRVLKKPGFMRTPEDLITLRSARQQGRSSPEAMALVATAGIGAAVGGLVGDEALRNAAIGGLTGAAAAMPFFARGMSVPRNMGQAGAVKGPGGTWHPKVAEEFASPIKDKATTIADVPRGMRVSQADHIYAPRDALIDRMAKNYVNKYLGTERDPLKDVQVPFKDATKRWEDLTDAILRSSTLRGAGTIKQAEFPKNTPLDEPIWNTGISNIDIGGGRIEVSSAGIQAIRSYLEHVGDFARNIPTDKLANYDFARLVRETAANDARVAAEAAKQFTKPDPTRVANNDALPTYKAYDAVEAPARTFEVNKPGSLQTMQKIQLPPERVQYSWKEIAVPDRLTPEQAKQVRPADPDAKPNTIGFREDIKSGAIKNTSGYMAVDTAGKPIIDNFTKRKVWGETPERAWHAGRLAEEGNMMGHCVGGYCEGVARGDSKIYSLRDQLGRSYATVETVPGKPQGIKDKGWLVGETLPDNIAQIKGPGNGKPPAYVTPFVQDFVRSGKWGEVRDLEHADLLPHRTASGGQDPYVYKGGTVDQTKVDLPPGYYTKAELHEALVKAGGEIDTRFPHDQAGLDTQQMLRNQRGASNTKVMVGLAATGLGALAGSLWAQDPVHGAVLGAIAGAATGFGATSKHFQEAVRGLDNTAGMISTRILNRTGLEAEVNARSTPIHKELSNFYRTRMAQTSALVEKVTPWMKASVNLPKALSEKLAVDIANRDPAAVAAINRADPALAKGWAEVRTVLQDLGQRAQNLGRYKELLADYFPLRVKDYDGLMNHFGTTARTQIERALATAEASAKKQHRTLTQVEKDVIVNREIRGFQPPQTLQPGYAKARTVHKYTPELLKHYYTPQEAILMTIADVVKDLETAKFFGRELVQGQQGGRTYINVDASIGSLVGRERAAGRLKPAHEAEFTELMQALFDGAERSPHARIQDLRNLSYATLLGDLPSAVMQVGDVIGTGYSQGYRNALIGAGRALTGNSKLTMKAMGMADHVAEDIARSAAPGSRRGTQATVAGAAIGGVAGALLADDVKGALPGAVAGAFTGRAFVNGTAEVLNRALKQGVFAPMDTFGKNTNLGASLRNFQQRAQTPAGQAQIKEWYGTAFGKDFPQLVDDLRVGRMSEDVRTLAFMEMSRTQPLSKMEQSKLLAEHPNARLMGALKMWAAKQADVFRRDAYNKIKNGDLAEKAKGLKNLALFGAALAASNMAPQYIKDFILGRETDFETSDVFMNVLKTFGLSNYVVDRIQDGGVGVLAAIGSSVVPPIAIFDRIVAADPRAVQYIPIVGELYYNWELGGREEDEIRKAKAFKKRTGSERDLSPRAEDYRDLKRERARDRREALER